MRIEAQPLTPAAFAPFGDVLSAPGEFGRIYYTDALATLRPHARPSLSVAHIGPASAFPLRAERMERHEFSSQTFVPIDVSRYLVLVAPKSASGRPDVNCARAFLAGPSQGITYRHDVWHHPMCALDRPARFAIFMWLDGTGADEEFLSLETALTIDLPPS
jgi:ureidoglycolate lyase